ncbi:MAG TPA: hypothetical protein VGR35_21820 [Tepidisphaeraceae bacterium]|nr:hypothetical protein [Tepidisphaeraceae bacterium]
MAHTLSYLRPLFHEEQHLRGSRAVYFVAGVFGLVIIVIFGTMLVLGTIVWPAIGIVALAAGVIVSLVLTSRMATVVDAAGVHVRYFPFLRKTFALSDIVGWDVRTYDPMEYGGWGVRGFPDRYGWAYNVRGNRGVEIEFRNGHRLMLGSQRAEELAQAIQEAKHEAG